MERGFVSLWRKTLDSEIFQNANALKMFIWGLLKATHKEMWIPIKVGRGTKTVHLKPDQFIFGRNKAAEELGVTPSSARYWLDFVENTGIWATLKGQHFSIVTIRNWEHYQGANQKLRHQSTPSKRHQSTTNNNNNNNKNIYSQAAEEIYSLCPRKADKHGSIRSIEKLLKAGVTKESLLRAVENYKALIQREETEKKYIIQTNNFFGQKARYKDFLGQVETEPKSSQVELAMQRCKERGDI